MLTSITTPIVIAVIVFAIAMFVMAMILMRSAGMASRAEEREEILREARLQREMIEATHGGTMTDPDLWDFEQGKPRF